MGIAKSIEVIEGSEESFDDAVDQALTEASKSVDNIKSIYIKNMEAKVEDNEIVDYGINAKVTFEVEDRLAAASPY